MPMRVMTTPPSGFKLFHDDLINNLRPSDAKALFDLLTAINNDRDDMVPVIAQACDELDLVISRMG